jgi:hypothetical protein
MDGFLNYMPDIPIITLYGVFNYLITLRSDYDRGNNYKSFTNHSKISLYRLHFDGRVEDFGYVELTKEDPLCESNQIT